MNAHIARTLLALAAFLVVALVLGVFAGAARGLVLCAVALLCLTACRMKLPAAQRDDASEAPGAPFGVCVLDEEQRVLWCNGSAAGHFGVRPRAATGLPASRLVFAQEFDAWLAAGDFSRPLKVKTVRGEGTELSISLVPHLHSQWLLLSRDVTSEARNEVLRRDGVGDALHELCTPVTVLAGHLETVRRLKLDPWRAADYLELMEQQCLRMQSTIGELVKLWSLDSVPAPAADERVDVAGMLARIRGDMEGLSGGRHYIALSADAGVGLFGSPGDLASAFRNLAINAVRYTPPGGVICIEWRQTPDGAELAVQDNGVGIAHEHLPRLTERFYQVDGARSRAAGGRGIGLAIVKSTLERHQAMLEIQSEPGRGSRFCAKFPAGRVLTMTPGRSVEMPVYVSDDIEVPVVMRLPANIGGKFPAQPA
jgi:two-component system phosphate regulon sensor histidine kinase PhoR